VMGVTGRQTWSASSRLAQYSIAKIHADHESGAAWSDEKNRLTEILQQRRDLFIKSCQEHNVPINPTHDGFFAWLEHNDATSIVEKCASNQVYLVPLNGGVRIGLCAIPTNQIERVAKSLSEALQE